MNEGIRLSPLRHGALTVVGTLIALFLAANTVRAWAATAGSNVPVVVLDARGAQPVGNLLEILKDAQKEFTIEQVSSPGFSSRFIRAKGPVPNLGATRSALWVRLRVRNPAHIQARLLLSFNHPLTDRVSLFSPSEAEGFKRLDAGDSVRPSEGVIPHRHFVFPVNIPAKAETIYYLRIETTASLALPITLWTRSAFDKRDHRDQMLFGIIFGVLIAFVAYFIALAVKLRNRASLWFSLYVLCLGSLMLAYEGYLQEHLAPHLYQWNNPVVLGIIGCLYFVGAKFLRTFLNIQFYSTAVDRTLQVLQWMGLFFIPMNMFPNPATLLYGFLLAGAGPIFSSTVSVVYWIKGVPNAKYFAIGWLVGHLTSLFDLLRVMGMIPYLNFMAYLVPASLFTSLLFFTMAIVEQTRRYREFADKDSLTDLANRRYFDQALKLEWNRSMRHHHPISIILADVDFFKAFNDTYGHRAGDNCLISVARVLQQFSKRAGDLAARYGGEEFVVMLSETPVRDAALVAENIRQSVESLGLPHKSSTINPVVTVSLGVATMVPEKNQTPLSLLQAADTALYRAKAAGRNRVALTGDMNGQE
jgi:diguanylate cyclase